MMLGSGDRRPGGIGSDIGVRRRRAGPHRRHGTSPGARLRAAARRNLRRAGLGDLGVDEVLVDHRGRSVWRTVLADGSPVYVKVDTTPARCEHEAVALGAAAAAGVPVPDVLFVAAGPPAVLVLASVEGAPLRSASWAEWHAAGRVLRALHSSTAPAALTGARRDGSWRERCLRQADEAAGALVARGLLTADGTGPLVRRLSAALGSVPDAAPRFIHGDCMAKHVLVDRGAVVGLVDWADAGAGDPTWDLAVVSQFVPEHLPALLDGYAPTGCEVERLAVAIPAYWTLRHLRAAVWTSDHGFDPAPHLAALRSAA